jgi:hypothetical protein
MREMASGIGSWARARASMFSDYRSARVGKEHGTGPASARSKAPAARLGSHNAMFGSVESNSPTVAAKDAFAASNEGSSALSARDEHVSLSPTATKNHLSPASLLEALAPQSSAAMPDAAEITFKDLIPNAAWPR